ncbi:MAG: hypothetical protein RBS39_04280 [Phycisphaerales bacterium]|jgi:hypothetical protein|nr:hypothetical protein [Phycisphaerales bacterium]
MKLGHLATTMAVSICACGAMAQEADLIRDRLHRARDLYESDMQRLRERVLSAIDRKLEAASRPGRVDQATIDEATTERAAFLTTGAMPDVSNIDALRKIEQSAREKLIAVYTRAQADYARADSTQDAERIRDEREWFDEHFDLVPWGDNQIGNALEVRVTPEEQAFLFPPEQGDYRVEIIAQRFDGGGALSVVIDGPDARSYECEALPDPEGNVRILLTIAEDMVSADLGAVLIADTPLDEAARGLTLKSLDASFEVSSVRYKPVQEGMWRIMPDEDPVSPVEDRKQDRPVPILPVGAKGEGDCIHSQRVEGTVRVAVEVLAREGNRADLKVQIPGTGETFRVTCEVRGTSVRAVNVEQTRPPRGRSPFRVTETESSSGRIRDGVLDLEWTVRGSSPHVGKNRDWTVRLQSVRF